jgi:hypothetical protein
MDEIRRHHIERTVAEALSTCRKTDSLSKNGRISTNIKPLYYISHNTTNNKRIKTPSIFATCFGYTDIIRQNNMITHIYTIGTAALKTGYNVVKNIFKNT